MGCCNNGGCNTFTFGFPPGLSLYEQVCYIFQQVKQWDETYATISVQAFSTSPDLPASATYDKEKNLITFGIPDGKQGIQGPKGEQGPTGPQGPQGSKGDKGIDGFTPIARITISGGEYTLTITGQDNIETATWTGLPSVTGADIGKFMRVSGDGIWAAETVPNAETSNF